MATVETGTAVRRGTADDVAIAADAVALALLDDPLTVWTVPEPRRRVRLAALVRIQMQEISLPDGELWVADDLSAAAAWTRPSYPGPTDEVLARVGPLILALGGERRPYADAVDTLLLESRPVAPHWQLAVLGVRPDRQRRGVGARLLSPMLARCDAEGVPAYVETATEAGVRFYAKQGFTVLERLELPLGGPPLWQCWRAPRSHRCEGPSR